MGRKRKRQQNNYGENQLREKKQNFEQIPEGVHHYDYVTEAPWDIQQ
jgi:hypothetical protein